MSTEQNKAHVCGYMNEVLNKGNMAAFDEYFSKDVVFNGGNALKHQLDMFGLLRHAFPDLHLTIKEQIAEGDKAVTQVTFCGTHLGEYMSIPPTGKQVMGTGVAIDRIADGKVVEWYHHPSGRVGTAIVMRQQTGRSFHNQ